METLYLDSFLKTLTEKINNNKKYDSFKESINFSVTNYKVFLNDLVTNIKNFENKHVLDVLNANKNYQNNNEKFNLSMEKLTSKNNLEIKKAKDLNQEKLLKEKQTYQAKLNNIISIETIKQEEEIKTILLEEKRNISKLEDYKQEIRLNYNNEIKILETDFKNEKRTAITNHEVKTQTLLAEYNKFITNNNKQILKYKQELTNKQQTNDNIYLQIKTEYNEQSRAFNKKINDIKRKYQKTEPELKKLHEEKLLPLNNETLKLETELHLKLDEALNDYNEALINNDLEFKKLNLSYELKKAEITKNYNEKMTLLNSKLSSYKEENNNNKTELEKTLRKDIKASKDFREKERLTRKLTKELKEFDNSLNKEIIKTNDLLKINENSFQNSMLQNDYSYLKAKNNIDQNKALIIKAHNINNEKITKSYKSESEIVQNNKRILAIEENYYKSLLENNEKLELLPLEKQIALSTYIQERELNSLANDAHEEILLMQKNIQIKDYLQEKEKSVLDLKNELEQITLDNSENKTNANLQLNQEKHKRIRDYKLEEQNLKQNVVQLSKNIQKLQKELEIKKINLNKAYLEQDLNLDFNLFVLNIQKANNQETYKREYIIKDASLKNQLRLFLEKTNLDRVNHEFDLNSNQIFMENFFSLFRNKISFQNILTKEIINLYNMPAHPEVFKAVLNEVINFLKADKEDLILYFEKTKDHAKAFYLKKMDETTGYKYMTKHQALIDKYDILIKAELNNKTKIEKELILLENNRAISVGKKDRLTNLNNQRANRDNIRELNRDIANIEKEIFTKQKEIEPINEKIFALNNQKAKEETVLEKEKAKENIIFNNYIKKNNKIFNKVNYLVELYFTKVNTFYLNLMDELYISKELLDKEYKILKTAKYQIQVTLLRYQNSFLNHYLSFYNNMTKTLDSLDLNYINTIKHLLKNLENTYNLNNMTLEREYLEEITKRKLKKTNNEQKYHANIKVSDNELAKITSLENEKIQQKELKIKNIVLNLEADAHSLDDNINQVKNQYIKDLNFKTEHSNNEIERINKEFLNKSEVLTKNYQSQIDSLKLKTQNILLKYQTQKLKLNESSEQRKIAIEKAIIYDKAKYEDRLKQNAQKQKEIVLEKEQALKLLMEDYLFYENIIHRETAKKTRKDFNILKKSYKFKKRLLY